MTDLAKKGAWLLSAALTMALGCDGSQPAGERDAEAPTDAQVDVDAQVGLDSGPPGAEDAGSMPIDAFVPDTPLDDTPLGMLARAMEPGTWAELETEMPPDMMTVETDPETGRRLHIAGWTDDAHWDPTTGQVLYLGFRIRTKMIAFRASTSAWRELPTFEWPEGQGTRGHVYGNNAHDPATGTFFHAVAGYRPFSFDVATETWTRRPDAPARGGHGGSIEFFPEMGGVLRYYRYGGIHSFDPASDTWREVQGESVTDTVVGYHSLLRYHPRRGEVIVMGGNQTPRGVARIEADGTFTPLADVPFDLTVRDDYLLAHPLTEHYLLFLDAFSAAYDYDPDTGALTELDDFTNPWASAEMPISATIPELGVILFVDRTVRLYRPHAL